MKRKTKLPLIFLILPLLVSLACSFSFGGSDSDSADTSPVATSDTAGTIRTIPTTEGDVTSTSMPAFSSSSDDGDEMLTMKEPIYIQDGRNLITVFLFENVDTAGIEDIEYTITVTDASGVTIKTDNGFIDFLAAGEQTGVASWLFLEEGQDASAVDIDWTYYTDASGSSNHPFTFENPRYYFDPYWDRFTAVMVNNDANAQTNIRVDMIAYDSSGLVVGGGFTNVNFIPGNDQVGISINGFVSNDPVRYEFFPRKTFLSSAINNSQLTENLSVLQSGFFYNETTLVGGFLIKNNANEVMKNAEYNITIYEQDGSVSQVASGYLNLLWPGQTIGVSPGVIELSEGTSPSEFNVYVKAGTLEAHELNNNPLTVANVNYIADNNFPKVNLTINNAHNQIIDNPYLTILLYNAADEIIGGVYTYPDPIPANGSLSYEVFVTNVTSESPARIEAYTTLTNW